jgi:D-beta-D-heptose 7-phosphate kinase/D-beta-D-heptose 1-phosphate adenosyltransferase
MFKDAVSVKHALSRTFRDLHIAVLGDVMLDRHLWGSCERISQEAPVPIVRLTGRSSSLGGAANVAHNLAQLAVNVELFGVVGNDFSGHELIDACTESGVGATGIHAVGGYCTVTKTRVLADDHQMIRIDEELDLQVPDGECDRLLERFRAHADHVQLNAVIISDYNKGLCTPYFCRNLIEECRKRNIAVYVDPKGIDFEKYRGAAAIKPNRTEMSQLAQARGWQAKELKDAAVRLRQELDLNLVLLTLGPEGLALVQESGTHEMPTAAQEVFDVSGAGDTVIATFVAGISAGLDLLAAATLANLAAADVTARVGCVPVNRDRLFLAVQKAVKGGEKLYDLEELQEFVHAWQAVGLKVALTNGCFDLLHAGHVGLLQQAAASADRLIVALNTDASVRRLKGAERPLMPFDQRVEVLSALESVDAVVGFEEDTPIQVIETIRPDRLIKGGDYSKDKIVGAELVESYGGTVIIVPLVGRLSTTSLVEAINRL